MKILSIVLTVFLFAGSAIGGALKASIDFPPNKHQINEAVCLNALLAHFEAQEMIDSWQLPFDMPEYWQHRKDLAEQAIRKYCKGVKGPIQPPVMEVNP